MSTNGAILLIPPATLQHHYPHKGSSPYERFSPPLPGVINNRFHACDYAATLEARRIKATSTL